MSSLKTRQNRIHPDELERSTSRLSMAMWNRLAQLPQFAHLNPKDFPHLYEVVRDELSHVLQIRFLKGRSDD